MDFVSFFFFSFLFFWRDFRTFKAAPAPGWTEDPASFPKKHSKRDFEGPVATFPEDHHRFLKNIYGLLLGCLITELSSVPVWPLRVMQCRFTVFLWSSPGQYFVLSVPIL